MVATKVFQGEHPKFSDLEFEPLPGTDGVAARISFPNGWGASVIRHSGSYGGLEGLYELGVLDENGDLSYVTTVTNDVIGWLHPLDVTRHLQKIYALASGDGAHRRTQMIINGETVTVIAGKGRSL